MLDNQQPSPVQGKVQRLNVRNPRVAYLTLEYYMKMEFDKAVQYAIANWDSQHFGKVARELSATYKISVSTVHLRFKSMYGTGFKEYVESKLVPASKEDVAAVILNTQTSEEVRAHFKLPKAQFVGFYDRYFGVGTYKAAKIAILKSTPVNVRLSSLREDNIAILMSQYLGDGWYDRQRHALRIIQGHKQAEYLKWKVGLIFAGYNKVSIEVKERLHKQGHVYYDYYSGKLGNVDFPEDKSKVVPLLTPLGWLLWYLDDGCYTQDLAITIHLESVAVAAQLELQTYGIQTRVYKLGDKNAFNLICKGKENSLKFLQNFIEPYSNIVPSCMRYKTEVKI